MTRKTYLGQIKDLQPVSLRLRANVHMVLDDFHISPHAGHGLRGQSANILDAAIIQDLDESHAVRLSNNAEFAAVGRLPAYPP